MSKWWSGRTARSRFSCGGNQGEGREPAELAKELTQLYGRVLRDPKVAGDSREFSGMKVYVGGEVYSPRMLPFGPDDCTPSCSERRWV